MKYRDDLIQEIDELLEYDRKHFDSILTSQSLGILLSEAPAKGKRRSIGVAQVNPQVKLVLVDLAESLKDFPEWCVVGGTAINAYAQPRYTGDVDILILSGWGVEKLTPFLEQNNFFKRISFHIFRHIKTGLKLDFVVPGKVQALTPERAKKILSTSLEDKINEISIKVASIQGLTVLKLMANRRKDQADIIALLKAHGLQDMSEWDLTRGEKRIYNNLWKISQKEENI